MLYIHVPLLANKCMYNFPTYPAYTPSCTRFANTLTPEKLNYLSLTKVRDPEKTAELEAAGLL